MTVRTETTPKEITDGIVTVDRSGSKERKKRL